jgi:hypothetical protein
MEGPNGCQPKSFRFLSIGLLGVVKMGPRALHWGPTQISSYPTWRSTWRKFGTKTLGLSKKMGQGFPWSQLQNLSPYEIGPWNGSKDFTLRGPTVGPFAKKGPICWPICKRGAQLLTQIPCQMNFSPNGLGSKCKVPLRSTQYLEYTILHLKRNVW